MTRRNHRFFLYFAAIFSLALLIVGAFQLKFAAQFTEHALQQKEQKSLALVVQKVAEQIEPYLEVDQDFVRAVLAGAEGPIEDRVFYTLNRHGIIQTHLSSDSSPDLVSISMNDIRTFLRAKSADFPLLTVDPGDLHRQRLFAVTSLSMRDLPAYLLVVSNRESLFVSADSEPLQGLYRRSARMLFFSVIVVTLIVVGVFYFFLRRGRNSSDIVSHVSHDLRSPLGTIRAYLETLLLQGDSLEPAQKRKFIERAIRRTDSLGDFVEDLLDVSRASKVALEAKKSNFSITETALGVYRKFLDEAQRKQIHLLVDVEEDLPHAHADEKMIERVLSNLVENALRYTPAEGDVLLSVTVKSPLFGTEETSSEILIEVSDSGVGIEPNEIEQIFDRFYRGKNARRHEPKGTGLGLAIVKEVARAHGFEVHIKSSTAVGTTVSFQLPVAVSTQKAA